MNSPLSERMDAQATNRSDRAAMSASLRFRTMLSSKAALANVIALTAVVFVLRNRVALTPLIIWSLMMVEATLWRGLLAVSIDKNSADASAGSARLEAWLLISTMIGSCTMGSAFWLVALQGDLYVKFIVTLVSMIYLLAGFVYATPDISHRILRTAGNVVQGVLFWLGFGWDSSPHWEVVLVYCVVSWLALEFGGEHSRQIRRSYAIRDENLALLQRVSADKMLIENALREAKQANEGKSRFLAATSHDLRQPLHALSMFLGTLSFHVHTDEAQRLLGRIKETVQVLEEQFNSLLDLSRFDVGAVVAEIKP